MEKMKTKEKQTLEDKCLWIELGTDPKCQDCSAYNESCINYTPSWFKDAGYNEIIQETYRLMEVRRK